MLCCGSVIWAITVVGDAVKYFAGVSGEFCRADGLQALAPYFAVEYVLHVSATDWRHR